MKKLFSIAIAILACGLIWCAGITIEPFYLSKNVKRIACGESLVCLATQDSLITWRVREDLSLKRDLALRLRLDMWIDQIAVSADKRVWLLYDQTLISLSDGKLKTHSDIRARHLAFLLYTLCERQGWAEDARPYNDLVTAWLSIEKQAQDKGIKDDQIEAEF